LKEEFAGQVNLIYIDPPFNTTNDSFQYNDSFKHSTWLTFMKNRLEVAQRLLKQNGGSILVHIDDIEVHYLKVMMDEIFGRENFIANIAVKSSTPSGVKTAHKNTSLIKQKDHILFYKAGGSLTLNPQYSRKLNWDNHYSLWLNEDAKGNFSLSSLLEVLVSHKIISKDKKLEDLSLIDPKFRKFYLENSKNIVRLQSHKNKEVDKQSRALRNKIYKHVIDKEIVGLYYNGQVITPLKQGIKKVYFNQKFVDDLGLLICDFWDDVDFQNTQNEGGTSFPTAKKPEFLLHRIIDLTTNVGDIVLDYHLGSGTTAAVAHKMKRRYIGIEQMDYGENDCIVRLTNVIKGEKSGISKALSWSGGGSFISIELMKLNQNYIDRIEKAKNNKEILKIIKSMIEKNSLYYTFNLKLFSENISNFEILTISEQKNIAFDILEKNMLYLPYSEINDVDFNISESEKLINKKFYSL